MSSEAQEEATISYPSIAIVLGLAFLLYRYFASSSSTSAGSSRLRNGMHFTQSQIDQVAGMFPQLSRRDIMWDLQRNRGSVNATVERVLSGRGLDPVRDRRALEFCLANLTQAPPSFQPPVQETIPTTSATSTVSSLLGGKKAEPDLITRYKLQDRIISSDKGKAPDTSGSTSSTAWGATKDERQQALKKRRDEMILEARRKMLEKDVSKGAAQ